VEGHASLPELGRCDGRNFLLCDHRNCPDERFSE
jgi:hypothetical protein